MHKLNNIHEKMACQYYRKMFSFSRKPRLFVEKIAQPFEIGIFCPLYTILLLPEGNAFDIEYEFC